MKPDYMKKEKYPTEMKSKKMWCRNCGRQKEVSALYCKCGKSSWSMRKIL